MRKKLIGVFTAAFLALSLFAAVNIYADQTGGSTTSGTAERTVLLYICGADLETEAGLATGNLKQVLSARFSAGNKVNVVVMTGGAEEWWLSPDECYIPEGTLVNDFYDTDYNRIWEARGADEPDANLRSRLILLDGDGITGDGDQARYAWEECMSDPETLKAFIDFGVENYPAKKYDLVLWDHGGGPIDGFAFDDYSPDASMMTLPEILDGISDNAVTSGGGRFDFIDFDACLMNSVELNLALSDYTDYYIASAETEPGYGQDYQGWLDMLGKTPDINGYTLGTKLVDDYISFYKDANGNETDYVTLAVVDTKRLMNADFAGAVLRLSDVLKTQLNTPDGNNEYMYYDELESAKRSIKYAKPDTYYKDMGNLVGQLALTNKEISMRNIDPNGGYNKLNDYADVSAEILKILGDSQTIYSRYSNNMVIGPELQIDSDKNLTYQNLAPTGMLIYFPAVNDRDFMLDYMASVTDALKYIKNEKAKNALSGYAEFIAQQALAVEIGYYVNFMLDNGTPASEVNFDSVKAYVGVDAGEGEQTMWDKRVVTMIRYFADSEEDARPWLNAIIDQEVSDYIQPQNITVDSENGGSSFTVSFQETNKRAIDSVNAKVFAELPAADEFLKNDLRLGYYYYYHPEIVDCCIRSLVGIQDSSDLNTDYSRDSLDVILEKYIYWYAKKSSVWKLQDPDESVYALKDAAGNLHAVKVEELNEDQLLAYFINPNAETRKQEYGYMVFEPEGNEYVLSKISLDIQNGDRMISVHDLNREVSGVTTAYSVSIVHFPFTLVPMSLTPFNITSENADSIKLIVTDIKNVPDIQDTDNDGSTVKKRIVVTSIYQYDSDITNKIQSDSKRKRNSYATTGLFPDVTDSSEPYFKPVYWAAAHGIIRGYSNGYFGPNDYCTRVQFVMMLWRLAGRPSVSVGANFPDVDPSLSTYKAISWAQKEGLIVGFRDGSFRPEEPITRRQVAVMLWRWNGRPSASKNTPFTDITARDSGYKAVQWGYGAGLIRGFTTPAVMFKPNEYCLRKQAAIFLYRYARNIIHMEVS